MSGEPDVTVGPRTHYDGGMRTRLPVALLTCGFVATSCGRASDTPTQPPEPTASAEPQTDDEAPPRKPSCGIPTQATEHADWTAVYEALHETYGEHASGEEFGIGRAKPVTHLHPIDFPRDPAAREILCDGWSSPPTPPTRTCGSGNMSPGPCDDGFRCHTKPHESVGECVPDGPTPIDNLEADVCACHDDACAAEILERVDAFVAAGGTVESQAARPHSPIKMRSCNEALTREVGNRLTEATLQPCLVRFENLVFIASPTDTAVRLSPPLGRLTAWAPPKDDGTWDVRFSMRDGPMVREATVHLDETLQIRSIDSDFVDPEPNNPLRQHPLWDEQCSDAPWGRVGLPSEH